MNRIVINSIIIEKEINSHKIIANMISKCLNAYDENKKLCELFITRRVFVIYILGRPHSALRHISGKMDSLSDKACCLVD